MKKIAALTLVLGSLAITPNMAHAYTIKIINTTSSDMKVAVSYGGAGVCSPDTWRVSAGNTISKDVGGCCAKSPVKFTAETGDLTGKKVDYSPPRTGAGLSCRSWTAKAVPLGTSFVVETK